MFFAVPPQKVALADLLDAVQVASALGLAGANSVRVYRSRYPDFPEPVRTSEGGRCLLWLRQDVEAWARATGRLET